MAKTSKITAVAVIWQDAEHLSDTKTLREASSHLPEPTITIGSLVDEDEKYLSVALENYDYKDEGIGFRHILVIPQSLVLWRKNISITFPANLEY